MNVTAMTNRVIVFRATKRFMEEMGRGPTPRELEYEIGGEIAASKSQIRHTLHSLNGADGLPFPTVPKNNSHHQHDVEILSGIGSVGAAVLHHDEYTAPVDRLVQG